MYCLCSENIKAPISCAVNADLRLCIRISKSRFSHIAAQILMCIFYGALVGNFDVNSDMLLNQFSEEHSDKNYIL